LVSRLGPERVRAGYVERLREALSDRDWAVIRDVAKLRLVTGAQLERLHFTGLSEASGPVVRRRLLGRLVSERVLATLERRIGGVRAGSTGLAYYLDAAGQRLLSAEVPARRMSPPGERFVRHTLAVTELYVSLAEQSRTGAGRVKRFATEPASWWPDGRGGRLKPDAYVAVSNAAHTDHWWVEVDRATEHLPTLGRKLTVYADYCARGQIGPGKVMPWVLVTVPDDKRCSDVVRLIRQMPTDGQELFTVALHNDASQVIMRRLEQP
jgi:hypothetical protein